MDNIRQGRRNQAVGKEAEKLVIGVLQSHGLHMVEKIGTPVRMIPYRTNTGHKPRGVFRVIFGDQVSGDIRAFTPDGHSRWTEKVLGEGEVTLERVLEIVAAVQPDLYVALETPVWPGEDEAETVSREWKHFVACTRAARDELSALKLL